MPSAIDTIMGVPLIELDTSAIGTIRDRPTGFVAPEDTAASIATSLAMDNT